MTFTASSAASGRRPGFTLVELLVAATLALIVMAALASLFGIFGRAVADSQDLVQLGARMRAAAWALRQDLQGATTEVKPFIRPEASAGYFEVVEGPLVESGTTMVADVDDIVMLTTSNPVQPFSGLISGTLGLESPVAEVAWFCKLGPQAADGTQLYNLYRRQLLVVAAPGIGALATSNTTAFTSWDTFFQANDLSVRREGTTLVANSLADLTRRQSRFFHNLTGTANPIVRTTWPQITTTSTVSGMSDILTGAREGQDLLLSNVVAFDVRVFDPQQPSGGAYIDLGGGVPSATILSAAVTLSATGSPPSMSMSPISSTFPANAYKFWDTWSLHTEWNGIGDLVDISAVTPTQPANLDRSTNWSENNSNGVVDDGGELEQRPPYTVPLRGVEIRIRCYDPNSQEYRQITVQHTFLVR